jgi:hypothetical protein
MMFFSSAAPVFERMDSQNASVLITPHRFEDTPRGKELERIAGKYCVEFNTFKNDRQGRQALEWWTAKCLEWCSYTKSGEGLGDQKYLEEFPKLFDGVWENDHFGAGVAPWNLNLYTLASTEPELTITERTSGKTEPAIFFHYQNMRYIGKHWVNLNSQTDDIALKYAFYIPYLKKLQETKEMLRTTYGVKVRVSRAISKNPMVAWIQDKIMPYRLSRMSDLIDMRKV